MDAPPGGTRIDAASKRGWSESWSAYNTERTWAVVDELLAIAGEVGKSPAQVALNWLLQQPGVTAPITGARTLEQLHDNLGAAGWQLDDEHTARLTRVSELDLPYPYGFIRQVVGER